MLPIQGPALFLIAALALPQNPPPTLVKIAPSSVRMVDVNTDGLRDLLTNGPDGSLSVALNRGQRVFEETAQELPAVVVSAVLAEDLDGDGHVDLYLVSLQANAALVGDGTGLFYDATAELGLADEGAGVGAELSDLDADGTPDLLLHNERGDVVFWGSHGRPFERGPATSVLPEDDDAVATMQTLVERSVEILARDPGREIVLTVDEHGRPIATGGRGGRGGGEVPGQDPGSSLGGETPVTPPGQPPSGGSAGPGIITPALGPPVIPLIGLTTEEKEILSHQSIVFLPDGLGGMVKTLRMSDINLQVVNGLGSTATINGLGNLIVGYNETGNFNGDNRTGSHNIVGGNRNSFSSHGGLVVGDSNTVSGTFATVGGGLSNTASGTFSSVSGGRLNDASGSYASVSGGLINTAGGKDSSVSGGQFNSASSTSASVSGGRDNTAAGYGAWVSGGQFNTASGYFNSVSGGSFNLASGFGASVSGGQENTASGYAASVSGGQYNLASDYYSSVSGGRNNDASGNAASVSGGQFNTASGLYSSVSGGRLNDASGTAASVSGGQFNTASGFAASVSGGNGVTASTTNSWAAGTYSYP